MASFFGGGFDGCVAAEDDEVGERDALVAGLFGVEVLLNGFEFGEHRREFGGLIYGPVLLRSEADARAVGAAALVAAAEGGG